MDGLNCGHQRGEQVRPFAKFRLELAHYIIQVKRYSGRQGIKFTKSSTCDVIYDEPPTAPEYSTAPVLGSICAPFSFMYIHCP